ARGGLLMKSVDRSPIPGCEGSAVDLASPVSSVRVRLEAVEGIWLDRAPILSPGEGADRLRSILAAVAGSTGCLLYLDVAGPIGYRVSAGPPCMAGDAERRELFCAALLSGAAKVLVGHRREGGGAGARRAEIDGVARLVRAGRVV